MIKTMSREKDSNKNEAKTNKVSVSLSAAIIRQKALELLLENGVENLSMRTLAKALQVDPMAIYYYIPNKATLLTGIYDGIWAELVNSKTEIEDTSWQEELAEMARSFYALAHNYAKIFPSLIAANYLSYGKLQALDRLLHLVLKSGIEPRKAIQAADSLFAFVSGFVLIELSSLETSPLSSVDMHASQELTYVTMLTNDLDASDFSASFEYGLQAMIAGIEKASL
jgi:AcrR family transcriptional regulator